MKNKTKQVVGHVWPMDHNFLTLGVRELRPGKGASGY